MKQLRHLFLIMALLITCTSAMSQESLSMWSGKTNDCPLRIGTLTKVSEDAYEGIATIGNDVYFAIKDGDTLYSPWWANVDDPEKMEPYYKFNSPGDSRFYFKKGGTFLILADKVINSNYDYSVAFTYQPPLCLNINGSNQQLLNTVCQYTGETPEFCFSVKSPATLTGFSIGSETYGFSTDPSFTSDTNPQVSTVDVIKNGDPAVIALKGDYTLTVKIENGEPTSCTIRRARYIPTLALNGNSLTHKGNYIYEGSLYCPTDCKINITQDNTVQYYIQSWIEAEIGESSGSVGISTEPTECRVARRGDYKFTLDLVAKTLSYSADIRDIPLIENSFPEEMLQCTDFDSYRPSEPMTLWYPTADGWSTQVQDHNVFLLGNGHLGLTTRCRPTETMPVYEKTLYDSKASFQGSAHTNRPVTLQ